jgi:peptidyl-prolyl cis-trans isomerase SurA
MTLIYKVCFLLWVCCTTLMLQGKDEVLFTVGDTPVYVSEFEYIYNKNNFNNKANYSRTSLNEYLDLYTRFRLKIKEAQEQGRDTQPGLIAEIGMYRDQLFESYLDREITQKMVSEAYERMKLDVSISQIFFKVGPNDDALRVRSRADSIYKLLKSGAAFEAMAKKYSDDQFSRDEGGFLGFYTALQINHKSLEDAVYSTPAGGISEPVKTSLGYHIIKVNKIRPTAGKVKVAIIKKNLPEDDFLLPVAEALVDSLYQAILSGADFSQIAAEYSDDFISGVRGGELEWFGINSYNYVFEEAAFSLKNPGDISAPVKTDKAWYIIRLINKSGLGPFEDISPALHARITAHPQHEEVMRQLTDSLKKQYGFERYDDVYMAMLENIIPALDSFAGRFNDGQPIRPVLKIGNLIVSNNELGNLMLGNNFKVKRMADRNQWLRNLYFKTERDLVFKYHREQLLANDRDLHMLMQEYRDGILLFDITEAEVWNKAMTDTTGLADFYEQNKERFKLGERIAVYRYHTTTEKEAKDLRKILAKGPITHSEELTKKGFVNSTVESLIIEDDKSLPGSLRWAKGLYGPDKQGSSFTVYLVEDILPVHTRTLNEARGFVIAAYQEELENRWVEALRKKHPVKLNEEVFNSLVK